MFTDAALPGLTFFVDIDAIRVVSAKSLPCPVCRAAHYWFVNRDGRTRCFGCAGKDTSR